MGGNECDEDPSHDHRGEGRLRREGSGDVEDVLGVTNRETMESSGPSGRESTLPVEESSGVPPRSAEDTGEEQHPTLRAVQSVGSIPGVHREGEPEPQHKSEHQGRDDAGQEREQNGMLRAVASVGSLRSVGGASVSGSDAGGNESDALGATPSWDPGSRQTAESTGVTMVTPPEASGKVEGRKEGGKEGNNMTCTKEQDAAFDAFIENAKERPGARGKTAKDKKEFIRELLREGRPPHLPCPRCQSSDTKFCYFNNYNIEQPRYFCRTCQRYWTKGGALRNLPEGAGQRKSKAVRAKQALGVKGPPGVHRGAHGASMQVPLAVQQGAGANDGHKNAEKKEQTGQQGQMQMQQHLQQQGHIMHAMGPGGYPAGTVFYRASPGMQPVPLAEASFHPSTSAMFQMRPLGSPTGMGYPMGPESAGFGPPGYGSLPPGFMRGGQHMGGHPMPFPAHPANMRPQGGHPPSMMMWQDGGMMGQQPQGGNPSGASAYPYRPIVQRPNK